MQLSKTTLGLVLVLPTIALASLTPGPRDSAADHMAFLAWEVGEWDATITLPSPDGSEPMVLAGVQTDRLGACGLWLITDLRMKPGADGEPAPPYEGHGVLGYDPEKGKLVGIWIDSKTDWLATAEGGLSADGKRLTLEVEGRHPVTRQPMVQEWVTTKLGANRRQLEIYFPLGRNGERTLVSRIDSRRRTAPDQREE